MLKDIDMVPIIDLDSYVSSMIKTEQEGWRVPDNIF